MRTTTHQKPNDLETTPTKDTLLKENTLNQEPAATMIKEESFNLSPYSRSFLLPLADFLLRPKGDHDLHCDGPILTDQSQTPMTDINNIMLQYTRTGMLPGADLSTMQYIDDTQMPSFMEAHDQLVIAKAKFNNLPLSLRNELSHDFRKFESWITDPENSDRAIKLGLKTPPLPKQQTPAEPKAKEPEAPTP